MGFHSRYIDEKILRTAYEKNGENGVLMLYFTAEIIQSNDEFSSMITDLFCHDYSKDYIRAKIKEKFTHAD